MDDEEKTKEQLIGELITLRQQLAESKKSEGPAGLHNDGYFQQRLDEEVARSSRYGLELSLIMLDIDNFEMYSKRSGQVMVDEALQLAGGTVRDCTRQVDIACHYGGSKFAIILPHTGSSGAIVVAERLRQAMQRVLTLKAMYCNTELTASVGTASFPIDELSHKGLICQANAALKTAKQLGGNQICVASDVSGAVRAERNSLSDITRNLDGASMNTIYAMVAAVDARNRYTYAHSQITHIRKMSRSMQWLSAKR